jgi:hypothetical protein
MTASLSIRLQWSQQIAAYLNGSASLCEHDVRAIEMIAGVEK